MEYIGASPVQSVVGEQASTKLIIAAAAAVSSIVAARPFRGIRGGAWEGLTGCAGL